MATELQWGDPRTNNRWVPFTSGDFALSAGEHSDGGAGLTDSKELTTGDTI